MTRNAYISNAILWAAAIVASAIAGAPAVLSTVFLPSLAALSLLTTLPKREPARSTR